MLALIFTTDADFVIKGKVRKRNTVIKINDISPLRCYGSNSILRNNDTLKRIVLASKYIFTGKISGELRRKRGKVKKKIFKVFVRRVLKGDVGDLSDAINFETRTFNSSNRAYVFVEGKSWKKDCSSGFQLGSAALLFSGGEFDSPLKLLVDPVPMKLEYVRRVKAVIKGIYIYKYSEDSYTLNKTKSVQLQLSGVKTY